MPVAEALRTTTVRRNGTIRARHTEFLIGRRYAGQPAYVLYHATTLEFFDQHGTDIAEADWPDPGIKYVSADKLRPNPMAPESSVEGSTVTDVLTHGGTATDVLRHESIVTDLPRHPPSPES
ncbi:hypothetical protein KMZ30_19205 [Phycicoccus sp. KQZ13P-1]|nr:hypothetical protein [Phycicoccus mangrovi]MBT9257706.1 hypothetical protein [Phycicoccus mangrovi]